MWQVTATKDDASLIDDLLDDIVQHEATALPAHDQYIGSIEAHWHQVEPKLAYIACNPESGTLKDRLLAEAIVIQQLEPFGFKRAMVPMRWDHRNPKYADWQDVEDKAKRLVQEGRVRLNRNGNNIIQGQVLGDGTDNDGEQDWHTVELHRDDPSSQALTGSHCDCGWGQFQNTPRTRIWKNYQNRPCSHIIAAYWQSLATPIDEDQAQTIPGMGDVGPTQAPQGMGLMQQAPMQALQQNPNVSPGGMGGGMAMPPAPGAEGTAPPPEDILPPFPMANQPEVQPTSIPGGRPGPTPTDPLQYPGGTFSSYRPKSSREGWFAPSYGIPMPIRQQIADWVQTLPWSDETQLQSPDKYHITSFYSPEGYQDPNNHAWLNQHVDQGFPASVMGLDSFNSPNPSGLRPIVMRFHAPELSQHAEGLMSAAEAYGLQPVRFPGGHKPHITVARSSVVPEVVTPPISFQTEPLHELHSYYDQLRSRTAVEQQYQNGDLVQLRYNDQGTWQGRSEEHGAGEPVSIPAGSVGEVLGTDPATGMVNALFMGKFSEQNVELEPFGATLWSWPSELIPRPDMKQPGPAIRRK